MSTVSQLFKKRFFKKFQVPRMFPSGDHKWLYDHGI